jgi:TIR domain
VHQSSGTDKSTRIEGQQASTVVWLKLRAAAGAHSPKWLKDESTGTSMKHDIFVSHASEDKAQIVRPLVQALAALGLRVWYDEDMIKGGDSIREAIDRGLRDTRNAVVVLSPEFLKKRWTQWELNALVQRFNNTQTRHRGKLIPIWHNVSKDEISRFSPPLADIAAFPSIDGIDVIALKIRDQVLPKSRSQQGSSGTTNVDVRMLGVCADAFLRFLRLSLRSDGLEMSVHILNKRADTLLLEYPRSAVHSTPSFKVPSRSTRSGLTPWVVKGARPLKFDRDQSKESAGTRFVEREPVRSMIAAPIKHHKGGRPVGVFNISSVEEGLFERETDFLMSEFLPLVTAVFEALLNPGADRMSRKHATGADAL